MEITRKVIQRMIELGAAEDWSKKKNEIPEFTRILFTSHGIYGTTGVVRVGIETGKLYATVNRSQALEMLS